jgi:hypothetical protein
MSTYSQKLLTLQSKASIDLNKLIGKYGVESKYMQCQCLRIEDDGLKYNLENLRYLTEITEKELIDNSGYHYQHNALDCEKLLEVIDHLIKKHEGEELTTSIAQHEIGFYLKDFDGNYLDYIPETDTEHIEKQIIDGIHTGEICASVYVNKDDEEPTEYNGWWKIK